MFDYALGIPLNYALMIRWHTTTATTTTTTTPSHQQSVQILSGVAKPERGDIHVVNKAGAAFPKRFWSRVGGDNAND